MRVKILKCDHSHVWYAKQIGGVFNVIRKDKGFVLPNTESIKDKDHETYELVIDPVDCEILPDETPQPEPFDLERALNGEKVIEADGREATLIGISHLTTSPIFWNLKNTLGQPDYIRTGNDGVSGGINPYRLFMAPKEPKVVTKWAVVCLDHHGEMFTYGALKDTKEEAINLGHGKVFFICISPIQITLP